jgi:hypothetical protein
MSKPLGHDDVKGRRRKRVSEPQRARPRRDDETVQARKEAVPFDVVIRPSHGSA